MEVRIPGSSINCVLEAWSCFTLAWTHLYILGCCGGTNVVHTTIHVAPSIKAISPWNLHWNNVPTQMSATTICPVFCSLYHSMHPRPVCQRPVHAPMAVGAACFFYQAPTMAPESAKLVSSVLAAPLICWPRVSYALQTSISTLLYSGSMQQGFSNFKLHQPVPLMRRLVSLLHHWSQAKAALTPVCSAATVSLHMPTASSSVFQCYNETALSHLPWDCSEVSSGHISSCHCNTVKVLSFSF